ncbi:MAG: hypothetical protein ABJC51_04300, partial [Acidobacteriota bacterium]
MITKPFAVVALAVLLAHPAVEAQEPAPAKAAAVPTAEAAPARPAPPAKPLSNVSIEVAITDQSGPGDPVRKVVGMIVADGKMGSVRSNGQVMVKMDEHVGNWQPVKLYVDASPTLYAGDPSSILLFLTLEYTPGRYGDEDGAQGRTDLNERLSVNLESGKPLVLSRAADPSTNR